jgi:ABC-type enterochelin transport system permease subunit
MEITYILIVALVTYIFGAITKAFIDSIPNKFIPLQNVIIGIVSGLICYFTQVQPDLFTSLILCLVAASGAGGIADFIKMFKKTV